MDDLERIDRQIKEREEAAALVLQASTNGLKVAADELREGDGSVVDRARAYLRAGAAHAAAVDRFGAHMPEIRDAKS